MVALFVTGVILAGVRSETSTCIFTNLASPLANQKLRRLLIQTIFAVFGVHAAG